MNEKIKLTLVCGKMCMPCNMLKEWIKENNITVNTIFGEDDMDFCRFYQVSRTPTLVIVKEVEGSEYQAYETITDLEKIKEELKQYC